MWGIPAGLNTLPADLFLRQTKMITRVQMMKPSARPTRTIIRTSGKKIGISICSSDVFLFSYLILNYFLNHVVLNFSFVGTYMLENTCIGLVTYIIVMNYHIITVRNINFKQSCTLNFIIFFMLIS